MSTENNDAVSSLSSNSREASPPTAVFAKWIAIMAGVALIIVFFGVKPALEGYFGNNEAIKQQLSQNEMNEATATDLQNKQAGLTKTQSDVNDFLKAFPAGADQKAMFDELNSIASANGVTIGSITPSKATTDSAGNPIIAGDIIAAINLDLAVSGGDPNGFLKGLENAKRVFVVNSFSYAGDDENKTMSIKATTYVVQPLVNPNTAPQAQSQSQGSADNTSVPAP